MQFLIQLDINITNVDNIIISFRFHNFSMSISVINNDS